MGSGCAQCSGKGRILICPCKSLANLRPDLALEWHPKNSKAPSEYSLNSGAKVWWKCLEKSHEWEAIINYRTGKKCNNCPYCKTSKGEKFIKEILDGNGIKYLSQKKISFKECKKLRFDFYLPSYKTAIEFDGIQHFISVKHFGGKEGFEKRKVFDSHKNDYCIENGVLLLRIHYKDMGEIEELIDFILVEDSPIHRVFSSNYP